MACPTCGTENRSERRFCAQCGHPLDRPCPACTALNEPGSRFCGTCGSALAPGDSGGAPAEPPAAAAPERRLVSVLFVDLVGFTTLAEGRDPEDVRALLTRYFERATAVIERHGGSVEKFIGDAVMAVWGAPAAQEDDAERAVRAALELIDAVAELGHGAGGTELRCRAGVMTGEAVVDLAARGQGMVAGDLVNTAARIQASASPGTVVVGEATMRATRASIAYEAVPDQALKGKAQPVAVWRAQRVVAGMRGALRSAGLEAPFVGRERELRLVKELLAAVADERRARLLTVTGVAGVGKSRLAWELFKYVDGVSDAIWWHRGRCLAYGEGVTYWPLAEMVRMRAGIDEGEELGSARLKLGRSVDAVVADPEERRWVESRLADLLQLHVLPDREPTDLFAAWRLFFERLSDLSPTILVFEDLQWADAALLDFITYLIDWSRTSPLFIVALARPELADRHPDWGAGRRAATGLYLEPLGARSMDTLLQGLAPGLPDRLRTQIRDRAEGIPLYAVETVRMLLDRGLLVREGDVYRPVGTVTDLEVPESLQGLIAARLDGLDPAERHLLQSAAVLGKAFTQPALAALTGSAAAELERVLAQLVRKEILAIQTDPRTPERGQYTFLQDLVRQVAYGTLARSERRARHLRTAELLEASRPAEDDELIGIIAAHLQEAERLDPAALDAEGVRARAQAALARAARRATRMGASAEAECLFADAAQLTGVALEAAALREQAGAMALRAGHLEAATEHWAEAASLFAGGGETRAAARVSIRSAEADWLSGRADQALERTERAFAELRAGPEDADLARAAAQLGRWHMLAARFDDAREPIELALDLAGSLNLPEVVAEALATRGAIVAARLRHEEAVILLRGARALALAHDLPQTALRAANNLLVRLSGMDRLSEMHQVCREGAALAHRVGDQVWERSFRSGEVEILRDLGRWDEALRLGAQLEEEEPHTTDVRSEHQSMRWELVPIHLARGAVSMARELVERHRQPEAGWSAHTRQLWALAEARVLIAETNWREALSVAERAVGATALPVYATPDDMPAWVEWVEAAFGCEELALVEERLGALSALRPGAMRPSLHAHAARLRARLRARRGDLDQAAADAARAAAIFREVGMPFPLAVTLVEAAERLAGSGRWAEAEALLAEARPILEELRAEPWLRRAAEAARQASVV